MRAHEFLSEAPTLAPQELFKYSGGRKDRVPLFLQKIKNQEPFTVKTKTGSEEIVLDPAEYDRVEAWTTTRSDKSIKIKARDDNRMVPIGAIKKTKEFGGEEAGQRERVEQGQIEGIAQELEAAKAGKPFVTLIVGGKKVRAASVEKERGSVGGRAPKSDMTVLDEEGNAVAWVSLKDTTFRWGGWHHLSAVPEIAQWLDRIRAVNNGVFEPGQSFGLNISDDIKQKIIYGKEFGKAPGFSNVDAAMIGWTSVKKQGNAYVLSADAVYSNGDIPQGKHNPYLVMRYMTGRSDLGFKNARGETNTMGEGRKVKWLDTDADVESAKKMFSDEAAHKASIAGLKPKQRAAANKEFKASRQTPTPTPTPTATDTPTLEK
jgi:hypothetical protein